MTFKRAKTTSSAKDAVGTVRVKVILQDPGLLPGYSISGNLRYEVCLESTTVGAVKAAIENALFGDGAA
jgi:hypothetical protein